MKIEKLSWDTITGDKIYQPYKEKSLYETVNELVDTVNKLTEDKGETCSKCGCDINVIRKRVTRPAGNECLSPYMKSKVMIFGYAPKNWKQIFKEPEDPLVEAQFPAIYKTCPEHSVPVYVSIEDAGFQKDGSGVKGEKRITHCVDCEIILTFKDEAEGYTKCVACRMKPKSLYEIVLDHNCCSHYNGDCTKCSNELVSAIRTHIKEIAEGMKMPNILQDIGKFHKGYNQALKDLVERI